jgi:hypothetical protein
MTKKDTPLGDALVTFANIGGVDIDTVGESTGRVEL